jgi:hypothetical protein
MATKQSNSTITVLKKTLATLKKEASDRERQIAEALKTLTKSEAPESVSRSNNKTKDEKLTDSKVRVRKKDVLQALDKVLKEMVDMVKIRKKIRNIENKIQEIYENH